MAIFTKLLLALVLPPLAIAFLAVPLFFVGVWACGVSGRNLGVEDHGAPLGEEAAGGLTQTGGTPRDDC